MAERKNLTAEKVMYILQLNQEGEMVTELQKEELNPPETGELGGTAAEPWPFKPKTGSLFPKKKRPVKNMVFRYITRCFSVFSRRRPPPPSSSAGNFQLDNGESCFTTVSPLKPVDGGSQGGPQEELPSSAVFLGRA